MSFQDCGAEPKEAVSRPPATAAPDRAARLLRASSYVARYSLLLFIVLVFYANTVVEQHAGAFVYASLNEVPYNDVGLLLGTARYQPGGGINPYFSHRIDAAVDLFDAGKVRYILASGDNRHASYNEPAAMREELIKRGVPVEYIYLDHAGFNTYDSILRAQRVYGQSQITVISQAFHAERALYIADHFQIEAVAYRARDVNGVASLRMTVREYLSRLKVLIDIHVLRRRPYFDNEVQPIPRQSEAHRQPELPVPSARARQ